MRPVVLLAVSVFGACYPLLLLLLLLCDHHFKVWGLKEQVETPLYRLPARRPETYAAPLGLSFPFCAAEAQLGCSASPFQP